jgi:hypothetical protein
MQLPWQERLGGGGSATAAISGVVWNGKHPVAR